MTGSERCCLLGWAPPFCLIPCRIWSCLVLEAQPRGRGLFLGALNLGLGGCLLPTASLYAEAAPKLGSAPGGNFPGESTAAACPSLSCCCSTLSGGWGLHRRFWRLPPNSFQHTCCTECGGLSGLRWQLQRLLGPPSFSWEGECLVLCVCVRDDRLASDADSLSSVACCWVCADVATDEVSRLLPLKWPIQL